MNDLTIKTFIQKPYNQHRLEFWGATTIFGLALLSLAIADSPNSGMFDEAGISFHYYKHYFIPQLVRYTLLYLAFLLLNFVVVPRLIRKEALVLNFLLVLLTFLALGFGLGVLDTYYRGYLFSRFTTADQTFDFIFQNSYRYAFWLLLMYGLYTLIKFSGLYLLANSDDIQAKYRMITRDGLIAFVLWMVSVFLLLMVDAPGELVVYWGALSLCGIGLYCYSFYSLLPRSLNRKRPFRSYVLRAALALALAFLPVAFLVLLLLNDGESAIGFSLFNFAFHLLITVPLSWILYKRHLKGSEELFVLKKELGRSEANLDFLRSQINPHFLFNALNTLYGTALQEKSERTAQGIQMLGDMMRFMLHENHQQKILLSREIEYLQNYISLQELRTSSSPDISIQTNLEDVLDNKFIAPMLLIPFVENAFKHGISLKNKSWIRITLHCDRDKLYFDVYNSTHEKQGQDPEKDKSGIGLANVRQRLALLYPGRHELMIRETAKEFFVHLTLEL